MVGVSVSSECRSRGRGGRTGGRGPPVLGFEAPKRGCWTDDAVDLAVEAVDDASDVSVFVYGEAWQVTSDLSCQVPIGKSTPRSPLTKASRASW